MSEERIKELEKKHEQLKEIIVHILNSLQAHGMTVSDKNTKE